MDLLVLKIVADFALIVVVGIFAFAFLFQLRKLNNSVAHMADCFMVLTTHTQPDTLREVVDKGIYGGPTFLEESIQRDETCYGGGIPGCQCKLADGYGHVPAEFGVDNLPSVD